MAGREKHRMKAIFDLAEMKADLANLNLPTLNLHAEMQIVEKQRTC